MNNAIDISVIPIALKPEQIDHEVNALYLAQTPRSVARGRSADRLIFYLPFIHRIPLEQNKIEKYLQHIHHTYYKTKGTVTSAMRLALEELNHILLRQGDQVLIQQSAAEIEPKLEGIPITLAVLRITESTPPTVYIAQCGPSQIIYVNASAVKRFYDPQRSGQGLGVSRSLPIHFLQHEIQAGDYFLWVPSPTIPWKAPILHAAYGLALEKAHLHFLNQNNYDHIRANNRAILLQIHEGKGEIHLVKPQLAQTPPQKTAASTPSLRDDTVYTHPYQAAAQAEQISPSPLQGSVDTQNAASQMKPKESETEQKPPVAFEQPSDAVQSQKPASVRSHATPSPPSPNQDDGKTETKEPLPEQHSNVRPPDQSSTTISDSSVPSSDQVIKTSASPPPSLNQEAAQKVTQPAHAEQFPPSAWLKGLSRFWKKFLWLIYKNTQTKPQEKTRSSFQIPSSVMVAIAVLVPIFVVAITSMVYLQRGIASLNEEYYLQAQSIAVKAIGEKDPQQKRQTIQESLSLLDTAESYSITDESRALRDYLEALLDEIDDIIRVDFQPVLSGRLPANVNIKKIMLIGDDLYLFNATQGNVLRAARTAQGFELDPDFHCGPGQNVGPLIDVSPLTWSGDIKAALVGMDKSGQLLYCGGEKQYYHTLITPDKGWGQPKLIASEFSRLYALDTQTNAIWAYSSKEENDFSEKPFFLFSTKAPKIQDVLSMTVYRGDIYLLHKDGHLTKCIYNFWYQTATRCEEPASFTEVRSEKTFYQITRPDGTPAALTQILYAPPPDPSIYLLDGENLSIYHLSLRLTIQQEYRAQKELTRNQRPASSFAIGPNRTVFLAIGNNVYFATLP